MIKHESPFYNLALPAVKQITAGQLCLSLGNSLHLPSCSFINHTVQLGAKWEQVTKIGAWETSCISSKQEPFIKLPTTMPQHQTKLTQLDYTQAKGATCINYRESANECLECLTIKSIAELQEL